MNVRIFLRYAVMALVLGATGCGNKGALYLPDEDSATEQPMPNTTPSGRSTY